MNSTTRCVVELKGDEAVRAALPAYDAWLLLDAGTYTGANLISRIEACNATGVDIGYSSVFSADDVAAVKAEGHAFAVWTCDSDDAALVLAQKGVDEITTNRGGAMKSALAELVAEANELNEPAVLHMAAEGIELWGTDRYVQDGLVAIFDGIENAGVGAAHSDAAAQWPSVAGTASGLKFGFSGRNGSTGSWRPDGRYFDGNSKGLTSDNVTLGGVWTVQSTTTMNMSGQFTNKTSPASQYPAVFAASDDALSLYLNNSGAQTTKLYFKADGFNGRSGANNRLNIATFGGKYVTAAFDNTTNKKSYFTESGTSLGGGTANSANTAVSAKTYCIGGTDTSSAHRRRRRSAARHGSAPATRWRPTTARTTHGAPRSSTRTNWRIPTILPPAAG